MLSSFPGRLKSLLTRFSHLSCGLPLLLCPLCCSAQTLFASFRSSQCRRFYIIVVALSSFSLYVAPVHVVMCMNEHLANDSGACVYELSLHINCSVAECSQEKPRYYSIQGIYQRVKCKASLAISFLDGYPQGV